MVVFVVGGESTGDLKFVVLLMTCPKIILNVLVPCVVKEAQAWVEGGTIINQAYTCGSCGIMNHVRLMVVCITGHDGCLQTVQ